MSSRTEKIYSEAYKAGRNSSAIDQFANNFSPSFSSEDEIRDKGFKQGMKDQFEHGSIDEDEEDDDTFHF